jgi:hypothetical protein
VTETTDTGSTGIRDAPGGALLHPIALLCIAALILNDHMLKHEVGGWWTGKLSDFAGLVFFPLLVHAGWEYIATWTGRSRAGSRRVLIGCLVVTAVGFSIIQLWDPAGDAYRAGLAAVQWPYHAVVAVISGDPTPSVGRVHLTQDPTDLIALPALGVAAWLGWNR